MCDFPKNGLKNHPKVITLPHLGASTGEAEENCAVMVADTLKDFLENGNIRNSVNYPEAVLPRAPNSTRLAIANSNVPNMVGQISTCLATANLNIAEPAEQVPRRIRLHAHRYRRRRGRRHREKDSQHRRRARRTHSLIG